jgi:hypothetical protein
LQVAARSLPDVCKGRPDLIALGRRLLRELARLSDDVDDLTLAVRVETLLGWLRVLARPDASGAERRQANADLNEMNRILEAEALAAERESGRA